MTHNAEQAADAIMALINSRVQSPTRAEIVAIIATATPPVLRAREPAHRAEWDALIAKSNAGQARATKLEDAGAPFETVSAAEDVCREVESELDDCARRIWKEPVTGSATEVFLLAQVCFRTLWSCEDLASPYADAQMAAGPMYPVTGICAEALAALVRGARAMGPCQGNEVRHD